MWAKRGLRVAAVATGLIGGLYMLAQYALARFNDMQERLLRDRVARENLRRRFLQNQEDCNFTIMALLPTLSTQIFAEMDVESISQALRAQSRKPEEVKAEQEAKQEARPETETNAEPAKAETFSDGQAGAPAEGKLELQSATETNAEPANAGPSSDGQAEAPAESKPESKLETGDAQIQATESGSSASASASASAERFEPTRTPSNLDLVSEKPPVPISSNVKLPGITKSDTPAPMSEEMRHATKLRLWNEIKHKSFERTLTTLYTIVFLSLQTYVQLNLLGRRSYIAALENQAERSALTRTPRDTEGLPDEPHFIELYGDGADESARDDTSVDSRLSHDTEKKYLTSSYWFLHHGWRHVAADVRRAVHEEVGEMPLKTMLTYSHFEALIDRIRQRVEKSANDASITWAAPQGFRGILLPNTERDEVQMLRDAGALDASEQPDEVITPALRALLDETKDYIDSPDFARVFGSACEQVFSLFLNHMANSYCVRANEARRVEKPLLLAKVLPLVSQQAQIALNSTPNTYVDAIVECRDLRAMSVLMYAAWDDSVGRA